MEPNMGSKVACTPGVTPGCGPDPNAKAPDPDAKAPDPSAKVSDPDVKAAGPVGCTRGVDPGCGPDPNPVPESCDIPQYQYVDAWSRWGAFHCGTCGQGWQPITVRSTCRWVARHIAYMTDHTVSEPELMDNWDMIELNTQTQDAAKGCTHYKGADREYKLVLRHASGSYTEGSDSYWALCVQMVDGTVHSGR
eukprot:gnl/MRDRNA2_/MRDRNA2_95615_c0_seq1.p1 gnl/MRDRNA2_/MRDRNA2_95615_c0~~gnl/MRDRNA2_/MRDRNA2_95615_c0_seq1.p1  ORF type:complete len:200 (-),score=21.03 gnl/MRDRNA2_/MRDRNA2_95615_c0_seq1:130-708(-)